MSAMDDLKISRRTLQRWLDDLDIESLEFENHLKVFLSLPQLQKLREYNGFMRSRNQSLINRYRTAYATGNVKRMARLCRELVEFRENNIIQEIDDAEFPETDD